MLGGPRNALPASSQIPSLPWELHADFGNRSPPPSTEHRGGAIFSTRSEHGAHCWAWAEVEVDEPHPRRATSRVVTTYEPDKRKVRIQRRLLRPTGIADLSSKHGLVG